MDKIQKISVAINSIEDFPEFFQSIQNDIVTNSSRLYYLLYGKDSKYEGPLYNGLQSNEWPMILLLVGNWVIETLHLIKPKEYEKNIRQLFFDYEITDVACKIILALIQSDVISLSEKEKMFVVTLLENQAVINFVNNQIEVILNKIKNYCCFSPSHKKIVKISNKTGNKCTFINSVKSLT